MNTRLRDEAEERRLFQLHGQSLAERLVENRIAGFLEIGEDDGVLVGEFTCMRWSRGNLLSQSGIATAAGTGPLSSA